MVDTLATAPMTAADPAGLVVSGPPYYVEVHVSAGECVSIQMLDGQEQVVTGPTTFTMISQQLTPPVPIPVQVPPGHMIHQIADENGTLKHIILSVMDSEDSSQLDANVINFPHGSFRVDASSDEVAVAGVTNNASLPNGDTATLNGTGPQVIQPAAGSALIVQQQDVILMPPTAPLAQAGQPMQTLLQAHEQSVDDLNGARNIAPYHQNEQQQQHHHHHHHHHHQHPQQQHHHQSMTVTQATGPQAFQSAANDLATSAMQPEQYHTNKIHHNHNHLNNNHHHHHNNQQHHLPHHHHSHHHNHHTNSNKCHRSSHAGYTKQHDKTHHSGSNSIPSQQHNGNHHMQCNPHHFTNQRSLPWYQNAIAFQQQQQQHNNNSYNNGNSGNSNNSNNINNNNNSNNNNNNSNHHTQNHLHHNNHHYNNQRSQIQYKKSPSYQQQQQQLHHTQNQIDNGSFSTHTTKPNISMSVNNNNRNASEQQTQQQVINNQLTKQQRGPRQTLPDKYGRNSSNVKGATQHKAPTSPEPNQNGRSASGSGVDSVSVSPMRTRRAQKPASPVCVSNIELAKAPRQESKVAQQNSSPDEPIETNESVKNIQSEDIGDASCEKQRDMSREKQTNVKLNSTSEDNSKKTDNQLTLEKQKSIDPIEEIQPQTSTVANICQNQKPTSTNQADCITLSDSTLTTTCQTNTDKANRGETAAVDVNNLISPVVAEKRHMTKSTSSTNVIKLNSEHESITRSSRGKQKKSTKDSVTRQPQAQQRLSKLDSREDAVKPKNSDQPQQVPSKDIQHIEHKQRRASQLEQTHNDKINGRISSSSHQVGGKHNYNSHNQHHHNHHHHHHQSIKFSSLVKQCRNKLSTNFSKMVQNTLSSYSDTKFACLLLMIFTTFALALAFIIHYYFIAPEMSER